MGQELKEDIKETLAGIAYGLFICFWVLTSLLFYILYYFNKDDPDWIVSEAGWKSLPSEVMDKITEWVYKE